MKSLKGLLLGASAGLFAVVGAQAADLPVKAKPVQYVKVCSLYGVGFYYIPGTDMCIKVGGYVREQTEWQSNSGMGFGTTNSTWGPNTIAGGAFDRASNNFNFSTRAMISVDARNQTEYGTVRGYIRLGMRVVDQGSTSATFYFDRAVIQWAGFTVGRTLSFFDVFTTTEQYSYFDTKNSGDTVNNAVDVLAYTAQFGNGISASISAESPHYQAGVVNGVPGGFGANGATGVSAGTAGQNMPDIVGQLRIDQNWGYLGVSGAVHQVAGRYFGNGPIVSHPDDKYGWAAQVGGMLNLPWADTIGASFAATQGAIGYVTKAGSWQVLNGSSAGVGWVADGIYDNNLNGTANSGIPIQLTNAWSVNAGYEHFWNARWRTSVYGGYTKVWYDQTAKDIAAQHLPTPAVAPGIACGQPVEGSVWPPVALGHGDNNSCSPNFSFYQIGTRTQWNVSKDFYMGVDVAYTHLNTAYKGGTTNANGIVYAVPGGRNFTSMDDQDNWSGIFRAQYNFTAGNEGASYAFAR
jgi:hypothetical protein